MVAILVICLLAFGAVIGGLIGISLPRIIAWLVSLAALVVGIQVFASSFHEAQGFIVGMPVLLICLGFFAGVHGFRALAKRKDDKERIQSLKKQ